MAKVNLNLSDIDSRDALDNVTYFKGDEPTKADALRATFATSETYSPTAWAQRLSKQAYAEVTGGPDLSAEELNKEFPKMSNKFTSPMNKERASVVADHDYNMRIGNETIQKGSTNDSLIDTAMKFGVAVLPHILDPVGFAIGAGFETAVVGMMGKAAYGAGKASILAKATEHGVTLSTTGRIAEALGTSAVLESATYGMSKIEKQDYDYETSLKYSILGSIGAPVFFGAAARAWGKLDLPKNLGKVVATVESQMQKGDLPDTKHTMAALDGRVTEAVDGPRIREDANKAYDNLAERDPKIERLIPESVEKTPTQVTDEVIVKHKEDSAKLKQAEVLDAETLREVEAADINVKRAETMEKMYSDLALCMGA